MECIRVPEKDLDLEMKLVITSLCSLGGHCGIEALVSILLEHFHWKSMRSDVQEFISSCIHYIVTRTGDIVPRPLGSAIPTAKPNEVLHVDYLYMRAGTDGLKYFPLIRDDFSSFVWIRASTVAKGKLAASVLSQWVASFRSMKWIVTDQGSHFGNVLHEDMICKFRPRRHFTTAHSPWANGTVERINREMLRSCKALLSEWRLALQDWASVCIQSIVNQAPLKRLGTRRPGVLRTHLEGFTTIKPVQPLLATLPMSKYPTAGTDEEIRIQHIIENDRLQSALDEMHKICVHPSGCRPS